MDELQGGPLQDPVSGLFVSPTVDDDFVTLECPSSIDKGMFGVVNYYQKVVGASLSEQQVRCYLASYPPSFSLRKVPGNIEGQLFTSVMLRFL